MAGNPLTGIALRSRSLEWTAPPKTGDKADVATALRADLEITAEQKDILGGLEDNRNRLAHEIRSKCGRLHGPISLGVPTAWVMLRTADLPIAEPDDLRGMVELQVDKFSPFPTDESVISYELLTEKEGRCQVLLSAIPTKKIDLVGASLRLAGIKTKWVDVNILGWWRLLQDAGKVPPAGSHVFIVMDGESCDIIVASRGQPLTLRALDNLEGLPPEEANDEIARTMVFTLTSLDLDSSGEPLAAITIWHRDAPPDALLQRLADQFGVAVIPRSLDGLPPLAEGLRRRALSRGRGTLDLAPPEWLQTERAQRTRRHMIALSATLLGAWGLALAVLFGGLQIQKQKLSRQEAALTALKGPAENVRAVRERALALQQYIDRSGSALECLREVSDLLPPGIELKSFAYHKGKNIELSGEADAVTLVYDFKKDMEKSKMFIDTAIPRIVHTPQNKENFKFTAGLRGGGPPP
jgi:hypothetical protein